MNRKKKPIKLVRNRNDALTITFFTLVLVTLIGLGAYVHGVLNPYVSRPFNFGQTFLMLGMIFLGLSFCIHGFHPLLLFTSLSKVEHITQYKKEKVRKSGRK